MSSKPAFRVPRTPDEFIEAAATVTPPVLPAQLPPVEAPDPAAPALNPRVMKQLNFDLSEPEHHQLKQVVESMSGRMSIRKFIVAAIREKIARLEQERGPGQP